MRANEHGGYYIRQSDLAAWSRCQLQKKYYDEAEHNPDAPQPVALSATVFGTVVHYAIMVMEKLNHAGKDNALDVALATFEYYWEPQHVHEIAEPIGEWLPRQTYSGLRDRGRNMLKMYYELLMKDQSNLLALELPFQVPLPVNSRQHTLVGTIDRLSVKKYYGTPYISIDDFKTGKQPTYLRNHIQGTVYAYASLAPEFWLPFTADVLDGVEQYFAKFGYRLQVGTKKEWSLGSTEKTVTDLAARRYQWINLKDVKIVDAGWRGIIDFQRLNLVVDEYVRAREADIYSPNLIGEVCQYCPFKKSCGHVGIPDNQHGQPEKRYSVKR